MEFRILGPLEVVEQGRTLRLGHGKERALLAVLLLHANEVVSSDLLIEELWQNGRPPTAAKALQVYVSRLRKLLGGEVLVTRPPGYMLELDPEQFDVMQFERLVEHARQADPVDAASQLRDALSLWRGPPLAEFAYEPFAATEIARLEELRLAALGDRIDADLALGRHAELVGELEALVRQHPLRERLCAQLMLALYRSGRQAQALEAYQGARRRLTEELGLEPSEELKELERRILAHDPALDLPSAPAVTELADDRRPLRKRRPVFLATAAALLLVAGIAAATVKLTAGTPREAPVVAPDSVVMIDPATNRVARTARVDPRPTSIAVRGDEAWVLHPDSRTLSYLELTELKVLGTVGLGGAPSDVAVDKHGAWISDARAASVTLIEPERLLVDRTIKARTRPLTLPYSDAGQLAIGFRSLWFASGNSTIARIDPATNAVAARIQHVDTGESLGGIAFGAGSVWVAGFGDAGVTRIDPSTNKVVARIPVDVFRFNGIAAGGAGVWVSDVGSDQVWLIDPVTNRVAGATKVGGQPLSVAYGAGSIWVANSGDGTVSRLDAASGKVLATVAVGGSPNGIAATDRAVWVTVD